MGGLNYNISPGQVQKIKTLARQVWGDPKHPEYYDMLWGQARVKSCTELKGPKINLVIDHLEKSLGIKSPRQESPEVRKIRKLWAIVSRVPSAEWKKALRNFLKNRFGVEDVRFLTPDLTWRVIEALKAMKKRSAGGDACATGDARTTDACATKEERQ